MKPSLRGIRVAINIAAASPSLGPDPPFVNAGPGLWIPPDPFRWVGHRVFTTLTGRSPRVKR